MGIEVQEISIQQQSLLEDSVEPSSSPKGNTKDKSNIALDLETDGVSFVEPTSPQQVLSISLQSIDEQLPSTSTPNFKWNDNNTQRGLDVLAPEHDNDAYRYNALDAVLRSTAEGVSLISYYETKRCFRKREQDKLSQLIVSYLLTLNNKAKIPGSLFIWWSKAVTVRFPSEKSQWVYYIPYDGNGIRQAGKFYFRYCNARKEFMESGFIQPPRTRRVKRPLELPYDSSQEEKEGLVFLKSCRDPWDKVCHYWEVTSVARYKDLTSTEKADVPLQDHISLYGAYELNRGYELIEIDYNNLPPNKRSFENFFLKFDEVRDRIVTLAEAVADSSELVKTYRKADPKTRIGNDCRDFCALMLLPYLVRTPQRCFFAKKANSSV